MTQRLKDLYKEAIPYLMNEVRCENCHEVPKIKKIQIHRSLGLAASNTNVLKKSIEEFVLITGQTPIVTKARKSVASFKIREKMDLGITVSLHGDKMYSFLDKLINITLPQIRDFRGISSKNFDRLGNLNFGLTEQLIFPEINYDKIDQTRGFDINIIIAGNSTIKSKILLKVLGFPFND